MPDSTKCTGKVVGALPVVRDATVSLSVQQNSVTTTYQFYVSISILGFDVRRHCPTGVLGVIRGTKGIQCETNLRIRVGKVGEK